MNDSNNYKFIFGCLAIMFLSSLGYSFESSVSSFECVFNRHYAVYLNEDRSEPYKKAPTHLSFVDNKTTGATLSLDGAIRATNSTKWTLVVSNGMGVKYIGNGGDFLTIFYKPGAGFGKYKSLLQWAVRGYAFSSIGTCKGQP